MHRLTFLMLASALALIGTLTIAHADIDSEVDALRSMAGCYLVDYNFVETEGLMTGYQRDIRVYDVNKDKSVKEWIAFERTGDNKVRLQHILFATDKAGQYMDGSLLKHQAEVWEYDAGFLYDFASPSVWDVKKLGKGLWTRKITNLDDGLRYQCAAPMKTDMAYPEWKCENYSPIPGRETRDMGRKDYNTLQRGTHIIGYGLNWIERQENTKIIYKDGVKTPLAKEAGKTWYTRLPNSECKVAREFMKPRRAFWKLLRETWDTVLVGDRSFLEQTPAGQGPRYSAMMDIEDRYLKLNLKDSSVRKQAEAEILKTIALYRK